MTSFESKQNREQQLLDLATYAAFQGDEATLQEECELLLQKEDFIAVLQKLIDRTNVLLTAPDKEVDGLFNAISFLIRSLPEQDMNTMVQTIAKKMTQEGTPKAVMCVSVLGSLFNNLPPEAPTRYDVFTAILKLAARAGKINIVIEQAAQLPKWFKQWKSTSDQQRELYRLVAQILADAGEDRKAYEYRLKVLECYGPNEEIKKEEIERVIVDAVRLPNSYDFENIFSLPAIQQEKGQPLYTLLEVFTNGDYEQFLKFYNENGALLEGLGLQEEQCKEKMRLLSFTQVCANRTVVPYSELAQSLRIGEDEVESWVIRAVQSEMIEANIDQLQREVIILRVQNRPFEGSEWGQLVNALATWQSGLDDIIQVIRNAKEQAKKEEEDGRRGRPRRDRE
eukprot:Clim_evm28s231 gene=Clim_evmTU28s231